MRTLPKAMVVLLCCSVGAAAHAQQAPPPGNTATLPSSPAQPAQAQPAPPPSAPAPAQAAPAPSQAAPAPAPVQAQPAPAPAPAPAPVQAPPAPATPPPAACFPDCRAGFVCHHGTCISACNPPCPDGYACTPQRTCEPNFVPRAPQPQPAPPPPVVVQQAPAPPPVQPQPVPAQPAPAAEPAPAPEPEPELSERDRLRQWRLDHLEDPHFTFDAFVRTHGVRNSQTDPAALAGSLSLGYARNTSRRLGFMLRGVASLGAVGLLPGEHSDFEGATPTAAYYAIEGELIPYLGPLGIFYIGPILSAGYHAYSKDRLVAAGRDERAELRDGPLFGLGLAMGFFAGETRRVHIGGFVKTTFTNWMPYQLGFGVGYRFGPAGSEFR